MPFSNLQPDILDKIFVLVIGNVNTLNDWKHCLPVLAICQNWRLVGVSRVYCAAIIEGNCIAEPPVENQTTVVSNIDLAARIGILPLMKTLVLYTRYNILLLDYLDNVIQVLQRHLPVWPFISKLCLMLGSCSNPEYLSWEKANKDKANMPLYMLITALPNVKHFTADVMGGNELSIQVMSVLANNYAHQLTHISCSHWVDSSALRFSKKVKCLSILECVNDGPLPKVNIDTLTNLKVADIISECLRGSFYSLSNKNAKGFEFTSLKYLNTKNSGEARVPRHSPLYSTLSFPSLCVWDLSMVHKTDRLLTQSHFPEYMDKLVVRSPAHGIVTLYNVKFDVDERKQLAEFTKNGTGLRFIDIFKYYLKNHGLRSELHAEFSSRTTYLANRSQQLNGLQTLVLPKASMSQLVQVVEGICSLKMLTVGKLVMDVEPLECIGSLDNELLEIASSIEHVKIKSIEGNVNQTLTSLFDQVLVRTQYLKWLDVPKEFQVCCSLVNKFSLKHPHIQQLYISTKY